MTRDLQTTAWLIGPRAIEIRQTVAPPLQRGEVRVRIDAAVTCGTDVKVYLRGSHPTMLEVPAPFGHEMSGTIVEITAGLTGWNEGDDVVVSNSASCGVCLNCRAERENLCLDLLYLNGAYGDSLVIPSRFVQRSLYVRPAGLDAAIAALSEPLACVLHGIEVSSPGAESDVVVYGGGPIGLLFVNVLTNFGHRVTLADPHSMRLQAGTDMGADAVVQSGQESSRAEVMAAAENPSGFDVAVEATGSAGAWSSAVESVRPGGSVLLFGGCAPGTKMALDTYRTHYSELTLRGAYHHRPATFGRALDLLAAGTLAPELLLSAERPLEEVGEALESMIRRETLKVIIRPGLSQDRS
ncbi:MAG: alcohol dehydrogenase catalytic domain-containing protein [Acidobacteriota bacterium]